MTATSPILEYPPARKESNQKDLWRRYSKRGAGSAVENSLIEQYLPLVKTIVAESKEVAHSTRKILQEHMRIGGSFAHIMTRDPGIMLYPFLWGR